MAMDINGIALWHLCNEKYNVTAEVHRDFLERSITVFIKEKHFKGPIISQD